MIRVRGRPRDERVGGRGRGPGRAGSLPAWLGFMLGEGEAVLVAVNDQETGNDGDRGRRGSAGRKSYCAGGWVTPAGGRDVGWEAGLDGRTVKDVLTRLVADPGLPTEEVAVCRRGSSGRSFNRQRRGRVGGGYRAVMASKNGPWSITPRALSSVLTPGNGRQTGATRTAGPDVVEPRAPG